MFDSGEFVEKIKPWLQDKVLAAGCRGLVFGLSGGIDSAVVAALAKKTFPDNLLALIMPCFSDLQDEKDARLIAETLHIPVKKIILDKVFTSFLEVLQVTEINTKDMPTANAKSRMRMITLYYHAAQLNFLVAGTGNRSELETGYFTKHGDSGVDLLPLGNLLKKEVLELAVYLGLPDEIINKPPSAGLWAGQTDEKEMGLTYDVLDRYLQEGTIFGEKEREIIVAMQKASSHKRNMPPIPGFKVQC